MGGGNAPAPEGGGVVFALFDCRDQVGAATVHRRISKNHDKGFTE
jgi:hypothetical protein